MIAVIGLGYVGLPLAIQLAKHNPVIGFDIKIDRVNELRKGYDRTHEVEKDTLRASTLALSHTVDDLKDCTTYIVTVPTPIDDHNHPDLTPLEKASEMVGALLKKGDVVVYESTVYPGVTEEVCGQILEKASNLKAGKDFYLGYSPERINPGDKQHTLETITKVVAGQTPEITEKLAALYGAINGHRIFKAASIKVAEAAKVIENTQRDINIAFVNEIAHIFSKIGISIYDVLDAASTKWNFLPFSPGLVGGHCIGVDPYYLADCAKNLGHYPRIILAGREINDGMAASLAKNLKDFMKTIEILPPLRLLVLGLTFKENIPDLRNTKVVDMIQSWVRAGYEVDVHDPYADPQEALDLYGIKLVDFESSPSEYGGIVLTVPHKMYHDLGVKKITSLVKKRGMVADLKGLWRTLHFGPDIYYWSL